jgi:sec-independent protein translocase protein TatC
MPVSVRGKLRQRVPDDPEDFRASLVEHLEELRDRVVRSLLIVVGAWVVGWYVEPWLYSHLNGIIDPAIVKRMPKGSEFRQVFHSATEPFLLKLRLSFMVALGISFPFLVLQLWGFVAPGLKPAERKPIKAVAPYSVFLFALGVFFCWNIIPSAMTWFTSYVEEFQGTSLYQEAGSMVFLVLKMMIAFGLGFQLPLIVFVLGKVGLLSPETLMRNWRQATAAIFFISAVITPSNDIFSMLMMAIPLCILFAISVAAVRYTTRKSIKNEPELNDLD